MSFHSLFKGALYKILLVFSACPVHHNKPVQAFPQFQSTGTVYWNFQCTGTEEVNGTEHPQSKQG